MNTTSAKNFNLIKDRLQAGAVTEFYIYQFGEKPMRAVFHKVQTDNKIRLFTEKNTLIHYDIDTFLQILSNDKLHYEIQKKPYSKNTTWLIFDN